MINWKLTKTKQDEWEPSKKENEKFLQMNQPEDTCDDSGACDRTEAGLDLKGTCMNESEGCDFSTVIDTPAKWN